MAGEVFEQIAEENGSVTPELWVDTARPEDSKTHELFPWDEHSNSERFLREEAKRQLASLGRIVIVAAKNTTEKTPTTVTKSVATPAAFPGRERDEDDKPIGTTIVYRTLDDVAHKESLRIEQLKRACASVKGVLTRVQELDTAHVLQPLIDALAKCEADLGTEI